MSPNLFKRAVALLHRSEMSESILPKAFRGGDVPGGTSGSASRTGSSSILKKKKTWRPKGLLAVMQQGKTVFANFESGHLKPWPKLVVGETAVKFEKVALSSLKQDYFDTSRIAEVTSSVPAESHPGDIFACRMNDLQDWALHDGDTIQLMISKRQQPCLVTFSNAKTAQQGEEPLFFNALLGVHRAEANLHVHFRNCSSDEVTSKVIPFDHNFEGGQHAELYQEVTIRLPSGQTRFEVSFEVEYSKCTDVYAAVDPFLFIADPHIAPYQFAERPIVHPESESDPKGTWFSAEMPECTNTSRFPRIQFGEQNIPFVPAENWAAFGFFDVDYYEATNPDVDFSVHDAFEHYCLTGWREKRNPNPEFNVQEYLLRHPDVESQDIDPLLHYATRGKNENRSLGVFNEVLRSIWHNSNRDLPSDSQETILARAQDFMLPMEIIDTRKLIALVVPEHNAMSGGIYSIFSIADHLRRTRHIHGYDVIVLTRPNAQNMTYLRNSAFRNYETVFRFEQLRLFRSVTDLQLQIPEYATVEFVRSLSSDMMNYLMRRDKFHVNILNQNTRLMPEADKFRDLRRIATSIGQSTAHHAYAGQEFADRYDLPTLLLPAYTDLTPYPASNFDAKENLIIYSDDYAPYRAAVMKQLEEMGDYRLVKIKDMTFDRYMELATRCRFSVTFGEGFDGYVAQPIYQGGIGFALYTDEFFPNTKFKDFENFFESEDEMIKQIVPTIRRLEADKKSFVALNKALRKEWDALYSYEDYVARIAKLAHMEYEVIPGTVSAG